MAKSHFNDQLELVAPTVHLNGTAGEVLAKEWHTAARKLLEARDAVNAITVNPRDYYVRSGTSFGMASRHIAELTRALRQIENDIRTIHLEVQDQLRVRA